MGKSYFNNLIAGNSGMLACIDDKGELIRLFGPDIDYPQHIDKLAVGLICPELWCGTSWLQSEDWKVEQYYLQDTNIAVTDYFYGKGSIEVSQKDFVLPDKAVLTRSYEIKNTGGCQLNVGFVVYSSSISTTPHTAGILYNQNLSALIHHKHSYYYSVAADSKARGYQLGGDALKNAEQGELRGNDTIGMMKEGALLWEGKTIAEGAKIHFTLNICMANGMKALKALTHEMINASPTENMDRTASHWRGYLAEARQIITGNTEVDELYKRSLLVFALMTNKRTGALLAAPEIDEEFTRCGRYAYCWGRDAVFIASALDKCGLSKDVEKYYEWAAGVQEEDGSWQQRYHMDGNLAPSWGFQIDEGASIIWGILKHYEYSGNKEFLEAMWTCVKKGVEFLRSYIDVETGLPWLSFDLWEERLGEHAYSTAAVCAGIEAGVKISEILGKESETAKVWSKAASDFRSALEENFWKPEWNRFVRSVRVKLNGWGEEHSNEKVWLKMNELSISRDYSLLDGAVDISLLGMCVPFKIYDADDPLMVSTAEVVESVLAAGASGGLMRYEYDGYMGGNPWIIASLWAALYHIERKSYKKAAEYFSWAVKSRTAQGLLPEQVNKETGRPAWVIPLTWSHAMFILVLDGLADAGEL